MWTWKCLNPEKKNSCGYKNIRIRLDGNYSLPATRKRSFDKFSCTKNGPRAEILKTLNCGYRGDGGKLRCLSYLHRFFVFEWKGRNDLNILRVDVYVFENGEKISFQK